MVFEGKPASPRAAGPAPTVFFQGILIHADTHGREAQSDVEHRIVDDDIAALRTSRRSPSTAVVRNAGFQLVADSA